MLAKANAALVVARDREQLAMINRQEGANKELEGQVAALKAQLESSTKGSEQGVAFALGKFEQQANVFSSRVFEITRELNDGHANTLVEVRARSRSLAYRFYRRSRREARLSLGFRLSYRVLTHRWESVTRPFSSRRM